MSNTGIKKYGIKANFIFNFISQILTLIIPLITTPYLARVLHETGNGQVSYVASIVSLFALFANLGFSVYGQREIAKYQDDKQKKSEVFWEIIILRLIFSGATLAVLYAILFSTGFGEQYNLLMLIMSMQIVAVPFDIQFFYTGEENFRAIAIRTILLRLVGLVLIFCFVKAEDHAWIYALCLSLSTLTSNLILWPTVFKRLQPVRVNMRRIWRHMKPVVVIFFPVMVTSIFTTFDKTMIGWLSSNPDYDNGCYEQAYKINSIAQIVTTLFSTVMISRNAYDYKNGNIDGMNTHIYKCFNYVSLTSLFLIAGFIVLSDSFSAWFLGAGYAEVPTLLRIMSIRLLVSGFSVVLGDRFFVIGKEKYWTIAVAIGAICNVGINWLLIPGYGAIGAAWATAITEVMIFISMAIMSFRKGGLSGKKILALCWRYPIAAAVEFTAMYFMQRYLGYSVWEFVVIGVAGLLLFAVMLLILRDKFFLEILKKFGGKVKSVFAKKEGDKMSKINKLKGWRCGRVFLYASWLAFWRKLKFSRDPQQYQKMYDLHNQCIRTKIIFKFQKRYAKFIKRTAAGIDADSVSLPHESSNRIWILWWQGIENAPHVVKMCYQSVLDRLGNNHEIVLLDQNNYKQYVTLPEHITKAMEKGRIGLQLISDLIRLEILIKYGGTWMDSTLFCTDGNLPKYMFDSDLFAYQFLWPDTWGNASRLESWFLSAKTNNKILRLTQNLMYEYFRKNKFSCDYHLVYDMMELSILHYEDEWKKMVPVNNGDVHVLQARMTWDFDSNVFNEVLERTKLHKLTWRYAEEDLQKEGTYYAYLKEHYAAYGDEPKAETNKGADSAQEA